MKSIDCFKNPNSWIEEFQNWRGTLRYGTLIQSYPSFVISTHLDGFLRPYSALERGDEVEVSSTFGPKFLMRNGYSYIRTKTSLFGQEREVYNPSAEVCQ